MSVFGRETATAARRVCNNFLVIRRLKYMCNGATTADIAGRKSDLVHVRSSFVIDRQPLHMLRFVECRPSHWYWYVCGVRKILILPFKPEIFLFVSLDLVSISLAKGDFSVGNVDDTTVHVYIHLYRQTLA